MNWLGAGVAIILTYLFGSIPTGYWTAKVLKGIDIRQYGSKSTGATNVYRVVGKGPGIFVFFVDLLKGFLPVFIVLQLNGLGILDNFNFYLPVIIGSATLIGHSRSIFLGFQGGKSAATGLGTLLALSPFVGIATFSTWLVILALSRIVSLSSITAVASCGFYMAYVKAPLPFILYCVLGFIYVTLRHKTNIQRLYAGTEPRLGDKRTQAEPKDKTQLTTKPEESEL